MTAPAASNSGGDPSSNTPPAGGTPAANAPWYGEIPAERGELREWVSNKNYKDPLAALESNYNLEKLIGFEKAGRTVVLPKDDKDVEGQKAFRAKLGIPEAPDQYELPMPELKAGETHSEAQKKFTSAAAQWLHGAGVSKASAQALVKNFNDYFAGELAAEQQLQQTGSAQALEQLKGQWGADFDKKAEFARRFLKGSGADDAWLAKYEATFGTADMLTRFHKWGSATAEHAFKGGDGGDHGLTLGKAKEQLEAIRSQRSTGGISDAQWNDGKRAEFERLAQFIDEHSSK